MSSVVSVQNVKKNYKGLPALKGLSIEIFQGECFGLLGPNGAGKSTLMQMIYGHTQASSGDIFVLGLNTKSEMHEIKKKIGVVPQFDGLDTDFSVFENLKLFASYFRMDKDLALSRIDHLLSDMKLLEKKHRHVEELSGGMKRRLAIARALLNNPSVLVLDEPTTGLDPQARQWIWNYFKDLKSQKKTILLTTHYMEEAERLCDRIAIIDQGVILDLASPDELIHKHVGREVIEIEATGDLAFWANKIKPLNLKFSQSENKIFIYFDSLELRQKFVNQVQAAHYLIRQANLNDVFLKLTGHHIRGQQ